MATKKKAKIKLQSAPWIDDPDEPDRMTDEQIERMAKGFAKLAPDLVKPDQKK
jgi:hypothetical protein